MQYQSNWLNYQHLYYFWIAIRAGTISKAAKNLRLSQSTLSSQIAALESTLGHQLCIRHPRHLEPTEAGTRVLEFAETIFKTGEELLASLDSGADSGPETLTPTRVRIGAISSLSKNFQNEFIGGLPSKKSPVRLQVHQGPLSLLIQDLGAHQLDVVLSNVRVMPGAQLSLNHFEVGREPVVFVAPRSLAVNSLRQVPWEKVQVVIPSLNSPVRQDIDHFFKLKKIRPHVFAEIEDVGLLRLICQNDHVIGVMPEVVVREELKSKNLKKIATIPGVFEKFYAITADKKFPNLWVQKRIQTLLKHAANT